MTSYGCLLQCGMFFPLLLLASIIVGVCANRSPFLVQDTFLRPHLAPRPPRAI